MHPKTTDHLRTFIARIPLYQLILIYVLITCLLSFILAVTYLFISRQSVSIFIWWEYSFLSLYNAAPAFPITYEGIGLHLLQLIKSSLSVVMPSILLGAVAFKLLVQPAIIIFKKSCNIFYRPAQSSFTLSVRFYSATRLNLVDLNVKVIVSTFSEQIPSGLSPIKWSTLIEEQDWFTAVTHIPFTVAIPLLPTDVENQIDKLTSIKGVRLDNGRCEVLVLVTGSIPELGQTFIEQHIYYFPADLHWGRYSGIQAYSKNLLSPKPGKSDKWPGWEKFDDEN